METVQKKRYEGIDFVRVICAILIVFMHTYCFDGGHIGSWVKNCIASVSVPFFFIVSGFFFKIGLTRAGYNRNYILSYIKKNLVVYSVWTAITVPVSWYNISLAHGECSVFLKILYLVRGYFFVGSLGIYWYLLSLICCAVILYYAYKNNHVIACTVFAVLFFTVGVLYNAGILQSTWLYQLIHIVFGSERNFLMVGLFYMLLGGYFAEHAFKCSTKFLSFALVFLIVLKTIEMCWAPVCVFQAPMAVILFLLALRLKIPSLTKSSLVLHKISMILYLVHFPFILVFDYYLMHGTVIDFPLTIAFSALIYFVINCLPRKVQKALLGS